MRIRKGKDPSIIMRLAGIMLVSAVMVVSSVKKMQNDTAANMQTAADNFSLSVSEYTEYTKKMLYSYAGSDEIKKAVTDPENPDAVSDAQSFSEKCAEKNPDTDFYSSLWSSEVLVHSQHELRGMVTRSSGSLTELHKTLTEADDGIYNSGILYSPVDGKPIMSLYKVIYDTNNNPAGYACVQRGTQELVKALDEYKANGHGNASCKIVNASSLTYIFSDNPADKAAVSDRNNTNDNVVSSEEITELCHSFKDSDSDKTGSMVFSENGKKYISAYRYMADNGCLITASVHDGPGLYLSSGLTILFSAVFLGSLAVFLILLSGRIKKK